MLSVKIGNEIQQISSNTTYDVKPGDKIEVSPIDNAAYQVLIGDNEKDVIINVTEESGETYDIVLSDLATYLEAGDIIAQLILNLEGESLSVNNTAELLEALAATAAGGETIGQNQRGITDAENIDPSRSAAADADQLRALIDQGLLEDTDGNDRPFVEDVELLDVEVIDGLNVITGQFIAYDPDTGDTHTFAIVDGTLSVTDDFGVITLIDDNIEVIVNEDGTFSISGDFNQLADGEIATVNFEYTATDNGGLVSNPGLVTLNVEGTNDAPIITLTQSQLLEDNVFEDTLYYLHDKVDIDFEDVDARGDMMLTLTSENGLINVVLDGTFDVTVENNNSNSVTVFGSNDDLEAIFNNTGSAGSFITYMPDANSDLDDNIQIVLDDQGDSAPENALSDTDNVDLIVDAVVGDVTITMADAQVFEDESVVPVLEVTYTDAADINETRILQFTMPEGWEIVEDGANGWTDENGDGVYELDVSALVSEGLDNERDAEVTISVDGPQIQTPPNSDVDITDLTIVAQAFESVTDEEITEENNESSQEIEGTIIVDAVVGTSAVDIIDNQVYEDQSVALGLIVTYTDAGDTNDTHTITFNVPEDWSVTEENDWVLNGDGTYTLDVTDLVNAQADETNRDQEVILEGLITPSITPPPNSDVDITNLNVVAQAVEFVTDEEITEDNNESSGEDLGTIIVDAVVGNVSINELVLPDVYEDGTITNAFVNITLGDVSDSNETYAISFSLPSDWVVSEVNGWSVQDNGNGTQTVSLNLNQSSLENQFGLTVDNNDRNQDFNFDITLPPMQTPPNSDVDLSIDVLAQSFENPTDEEFDDTNNQDNDGASISNIVDAVVGDSAISIVGFMTDKGVRDLTEYESPIEEPPFSETETPPIEALVLDSDDDDITYTDDEPEFDSDSNETQIGLYEDHSIELVLEARFSDVGDTNETHKLTFKIPDGWDIVEDGLNGWVSIGDGVYEYDASSLVDDAAATAGLTGERTGEVLISVNAPVIIPPANSDVDADDFYAMAEAFETVTDLEITETNNQSSDTDDNDTIIVDAVVGTSAVEISESSVIEDNSVTPTLNATFTDAGDMNDTHTITFYVPDGWSVTDAGDWTEASSSQVGTLITDTHTITSSGEGTIGYTYFTITEADTTITITTDGPTIDPVLYLLNDDGTRSLDDIIEKNDDSGSVAGSYSNSVITLTLQPGTYVTAVSDYPFSDQEVVDGVNNTSDGDVFDPGSLTGDVTLTLETDKPIVVLDENATGGTTAYTLDVTDEVNALADATNRNDTVTLTGINAPTIIPPANSDVDVNDLTTVANSLEFVTDIDFDFTNNESSGTDSDGIIVVEADEGQASRLQIRMPGVDGVPFSWDKVIEEDETISTAKLRVWLGDIGDNGEVYGNAEEYTLSFSLPENWIVAEEGTLWSANTVGGITTYSMTVSADELAAYQIAGDESDSSQRNQWGQFEFDLPSITPPPNSTYAVVLNAVASAADMDSDTGVYDTGDDTDSASRTIRVVSDAGEITLSVHDIETLEDEAVTPTFNVTFTDVADWNEYESLTFRVPTGWSIEEAGDWSLETKSEWVLDGPSWQWWNGHWEEYTEATLNAESLIADAIAAEYPELAGLDLQNLTETQINDLLADGIDVRHLTVELTDVPMPSLMPPANSDVDLQEGLNLLAESFDLDDDSILGTDYENADDDLSIVVEAVAGQPSFEVGQNYLTNEDESVAPMIKVTFTDAADNISIGDELEYLYFYVPDGWSVVQNNDWTPVEDPSDPSVTMYYKKDVSDLVTDNIDSSSDIRNASSTFEVLAPEIMPPSNWYGSLNNVQLVEAIAIDVDTDAPNNESSANAVLLSIFEVDSVPDFLNRDDEIVDHSTDRAKVHEIGIDDPNDDSDIKTKTYRIEFGEVGDDLPGTVVFSQSNTAPANLTSGGISVEYIVSQDGLSIEAVINKNTPNQETIFTLENDNTQPPSFTMTLLGAIDHLGAAEEIKRLTFDYEASDNDNDTIYGSLKIKIEDGEPVVADDTTETDEDTFVYINVLSNDSIGADGLAVTDPITITQQPNNGTAEVVTHNGNLVIKYTPTSDYYGLDSLKYKIIDFDGDQSNEATVDITINQVNNAPVAVDDSSITIQTTKTFDTGSTVGLEVVAFSTGDTTPSADSVHTNSEGWGVKYTGLDGPDVDAFGATDTLVFKFDDSLSKATIGLAHWFGESASDLDIIDKLSYVAYDSKIGGNIVASGTYEGTDTSFEIEGSGIQRIEITAVGVLSAFRIDSIQTESTTEVSIVTDENTPITVDILANDYDVDGNNFTIIEDSVKIVDSLGNEISGKGSVSVVNGELVFNPESDFQALGEGDSEDVYIQYKIIDDGTPNKESNIAIVTLTVNGINDAPIAVDDSIISSAQKVYNVDNTLGLSVSGYYDGDVNNIPNSITTNSDAWGIKAVNSDNPKIDGKDYEETIVFKFDESFSNATINLNNWGSDELEYVAYDSKTGGNIVTSGSYDGAASNFDINANSNIQRIEITAKGDTDGFRVESIVTGGSSFISTQEDMPLTILADDLLVNDSDINGDTLTIISVDATVDTHGIVSLDTNGNVLYTPATNYFGPASFTYTISDGNGGTDSATVTINVVSVNDAPEIINITQNDTSITENEVIDGIVTDSTALATVNANDIDGPMPLTYSIVSGNSQGYFEIDANGVITLSAFGESEVAASHVNNTTFDLGIKVSDGTLDDTTSVTINVKDDFVDIPTVDLPAEFDKGVSNSDDITNIVRPAWVLGNIATDAVAIKIIDSNSNVQAQVTRTSVNDSWSASVALAFDGTNWRYTPSSDLSDGQHTFSAVVTDDGGNESSKQFTVTIDTTPPAIDSSNIVGDINETLSNINLGEIALSHPDLSGPVTFAVSGTGFILDGNNNLIYTGELNFEDASSHTATVTATDAAGNSVSQNITVDVNNITGIVSLRAAGVPIQTFTGSSNEGWAGLGAEYYDSSDKLGWFEQNSDFRYQTFDLSSSAEEDVTINFDLSVKGEERWVPGGLYSTGYYTGGGWEGDDTFTVTITDSNSSVISTHDYSPDGDVYNIPISITLNVPTDGEFTISLQSSHTESYGAEVESWSIDNFEIVGGSGDDEQVLTFDENSTGEIDMAALLDQADDFKDTLNNSVNNPDSLDEIDLSANGSHLLSNLTIEDFIAMTDNDNTLKIEGTSDDQITLDNTKWKLASNDATGSGDDVDGDGYVTYTNISDSSGAAAESLQLLVDENIEVNI